MHGRPGGKARVPAKRRPGTLRRSPPEVHIHNHEDGDGASQLHTATRVATVGGREKADGPTGYRLPADQPKGAHTDPTPAYRQQGSDHVQRPKRIALRPVGARHGYCGSSQGTGGHWSGRAANGQRRWGVGWGRRRGGSGGRHTARAVPAARQRSSDQRHGLGRCRAARGAPLTALTDEGTALAKRGCCCGPKLTALVQ